MGSPCHRNVQDLPCLCPASLEACSHPPLWSGFIHGNTCVILETLWPRIMLHRGADFFYTCLLSTEGHITQTGALNSASVGFTLKQRSQSSNTQGVTCQKPSSVKKQGRDSRDRYGWQEKHYGYEMCWGSKGRRRNPTLCWICVKTCSKTGTPLKHL